MVQTMAYRAVSVKSLPEPVPTCCESDLKEQIYSEFEKNPIIQENEFENINTSAILSLPRCVNPMHTESWVYIQPLLASRIVLT